MEHAPIDIVISICQRHAKEAEAAMIQAGKDGLEDTYNQQAGKKAAYDGLIEEFEGFKKLFS